MADDDDPTFIAEELFNAATLFGDELARNVDASEATGVRVAHEHEHVHSIDEGIDLAALVDAADAAALRNRAELEALRAALARLKIGAIAFFVLVALLALVAEVSVSVQVSVAMATVLVADVLHGRIRG